jgi:DNA-binding IclR family transcriptional regulator
VADKVSRLVEILDLLLQAPGHSATLSEIVSNTDAPLSSTHDLLRSMVASGLVDVDAAKRYRGGPVLLRLGLAAIDQVDVVATARPHLDQLVRSVSHDAYLAVRAGDSVSYVARRAGTYRAGLDIKLGEPVPLHASAVGKLFAALQPDLESWVLSRPLPQLTAHTITDHARLAEEFREIRERGTALSLEGTISGIIGFAAPVYDASGRLVAAVHVSAFKDNLADDDIPRIDLATRACADDVQHSLNAHYLAKALT